MGYSTEDFFDYLYDLARDKKTSLSCSKEDLKGLMEEKRLKLLEILKINVLSKMQQNISVFGTSGGGLVACFLSAIDHRMNAIIISNYGASFKSSIMAMHHGVDNYIPNILTVGECSEILSLVAPTPILISNGIEDRIFPIEGTNETIMELKLILDRLSLSDILHIELFQGGHEISSEKIFKFLQIVK